LITIGNKEAALYSEDRRDAKAVKYSKNEDSTLSEMNICKT